MLILYSCETNDNNSCHQSFAPSKLIYKHKATISIYILLLFMLFVIVEQKKMKRKEKKRKERMQRRWWHNITDTKMIKY